MGVDYLTSSALDGIEEAAQDCLSNALHSTQDKTEEGVKYIIVAVEESGIKEMTINTGYAAKEIVVSSAGEAVSAITKGADSIQDMLSQ